MSNYRIFETDEFLSSFERLDIQSRRFVEAKLKVTIYPQLRDQPYFGPNIKKLKGYHPGVWRYRLGHFRLFYAIDDQDGIVSILSIDHRKDAYR